MHAVTAMEEIVRDSVETDLKDEKPLSPKMFSYVPTREDIPPGKGKQPKRKAQNPEGQTFTNLGSIR